MSFMHYQLLSKLYILILYRSTRFRPCDWHGVWWLVLLLYTPLLHTSMSLLDCPSLKGETPRWFVNANIRCFQDAEHAPLGLFAVAVIFCGIALIPLLTLVAMQKLEKPYWVHCLVVPLTYPFKDKYAWWCVVELSKRVFLVCFAVAFKKSEIAVTMILAVLLTANGFFKPYKNMLVNLLDMAYGIDIFVMLCLRNTIALEDEMQVIPEQTTFGRNSTSDCDTDVQGYTQFAILLAPLYYFPFALALVLLLTYLCWLIYSLSQNSMMKTKKEVREKNTESESAEEPPRKRTQTVIDLTECENASPSLEKSINRRFSFEVRKPIIRLASRKSKKSKLRSQTSGDDRLPSKSDGPNDIALQDMSEVGVSANKKVQTTPKDDVTESMSPLVTTADFVGDKCTHSSQESCSDV